MNNTIIIEFSKLIEQIKFDIDEIDKIDKNIDLNNNKNIYRLKSIQTGLDIIKKLDFEIKNINQIENIPNIGKGIIRRIDEILKTGKLSEINENIISSDYLDYVKELNNIYGIGHKTAIKLIRNYNIKSISDLKNLIESNKINLPDNIKKGLKFIDKINTNIPRINIDKINNYLQNIIHNIDKNFFGIICGSYRRLKPFSGDIDMLLIHPNINNINYNKVNKVNKYFSKFIDKLIEEKFIIESFTKTDVQTKYMGLCNFKNNIYRIDIRFIPFESYYFSLLYFTGSKEFNKKMRLAAISLNYTLNEYGLYDKNKNSVPDLKKIKIKSENDIFKLLNLEYIDPSLR